MHWLKELFVDPAAVESSLLILALVVALGLILGRISFGGVRLGVAGILFCGLVFGHFGLTPNSTVLDFSREFGLVLFVFAVGLLVGPGFFNALRSHGLVLNLLTAGVVFLGVAVTVVSMTVVGLAGPLAVGLFCGATTNTPSLAAAGQALRDHPPDDRQALAALAQVVPDHALLRADAPLSTDERKQLFAEVTKLPGMAYAVSYPGGVFEIIVAILLLRWMFRIDPIAEARELEQQYLRAIPVLEKQYIRVTNFNLVGMELASVPALEAHNIVVSRVMRGTEEFVASPHLRLASGDILLVVGQPENLPVCNHRW
jgi:putative transport protein